MQAMPPETPKSSFFTSQGWRLSALIGLTLLMFIPLVLTSFVIEDRVRYQRDAVSEVSYRWGGPVHLAGPVLVIPVERERDRIVEDEDGTKRTETYVERAAPIVLMPETLDIRAKAESQIRSRGIFDVPVYTVDLAIASRFDAARVSGVTGARETVLWDRAVIMLSMPRTRSFTGVARMAAAGREVDLEPGSSFGAGGGIQGFLGDPRGLGEITLQMGLNGADQLFLAPTARQTNVSMVSNWPHPSFAGSFLPKSREIGPDGFSADWAIPHLARDIPQVSRSLQFEDASFGVRFYNPVDIYQQVQRAAKYGILFIALTFLTVFLCERLGRQRVHPAQFLLIGLAQCVFFLLLLSFAEQIGFGPAYLGASFATIVLISIYGRAGLGLGARWWALMAPLAALYATLFLILRSTDYALLAGSVLAFLAVALAMMATRHENWSAPGGFPGQQARTAPTG